MYGAGTAPATDSVLHKQKKISRLYIHNYSKGLDIKIVLDSCYDFIRGYIKKY